MTVGALVDRTYRQILEPPDSQPASSRLSTGALIGALTLTLEEFDIPEDENLLRLGSIVEVGQELMRVTDFVAASRVDVFNAVRDNIIGLYPDLWTVKTEVLGSVGGGVYPLEDPLAVEVVEANPSNSGQRTINLEARIVDTHPATDGRAVIVSGGGTTSTLWLRYRKRFAVATSEDDVLADLGLEPVWQNLIVVGASADLMAGRDVQAASTEWVQSVLQAENIRVGTRISVAGGLAQYRDILMGRFRKGMRAEDSNRPKVHIREVFG